MKGSVACLMVTVFLGVCFNTSAARGDTIYVSTFNLDEVYEINSSGTESLFATASSGLSDPHGLAIDSQGNLYVANTGNGTIEKFNSNGQGSVFANLGSAEPLDLAFDNQGNLFATVANGVNGLFDIDRFDSSGNMSVFASTNSQFGFAGLALDSHDNLYTGNSYSTIEKFGANGLGSIFANSGIDNPAGLTFDNSGNLYVASYGNDRIYKFDPTGSGLFFAGSLTSPTNSGVSFPMGLAFGSSGNLYVADHGTGSIEEENFSGIGTNFASGLGNAIDIAIEEIPIDQVPEPSSLFLVGLGLCSLGFFHVRGVAQRGSRHRRR